MLWCVFLRARSVVVRIDQAVRAILLFAGVVGVTPAVSADAVDPAAVGEQIAVYLDQSRVLKLPERTATLVVGNPLIADISVQAGGVLVLTGKGYGVTNLIALDRNGVLLMEHPVQVQGARDNVVAVYRGIERESYSCTPDCNRRVTLGDAAPYFTTNMSQFTTLNAQAQAGGAQPR
jgi:Flp pilus assembly secretin CpaC